MIKEIGSTLPNFKSFIFDRGLNIIVAKRHSKSGTKDTRNGTGKTSLIELIHFVLSEKKLSNSDFYKAELSGQDFEVIFKDASAECYSVRKKVEGKTEEVYLDGAPIERPELRKRLAHSWFQLSSDITDQKYSPTFGALLAYFVRKERNGGFANATQNSPRQLPWDTQVNLSYLLGFDWSLPQSLQNLKDQKKSADELYKMLTSGLLSRFDLDPSRMQVRFDILETEIDRKRVEINEAVVADDYRGMEEQANSISRLIRIENERNLADLDLIDDIDASLSEVQLAEESDIENLYNEVGVFFPEQVTERFEQVRAFHKKVAQNRKSQLENELAAARHRLTDRKQYISSLQQELKQHLRVLRSSIAIERYAALQSELTTLEQEQADLSVQMPRIRDVDEARKNYKAKIERTVELIGEDVLDRRSARTEATRLFAEISRHLYDEPGELSIGRSRGTAGLSIETNIRGKKSGGKNHMQIFCFDLTLAIIAKRQDKFPGFLIHDSHIFDGVDGRQIGLALDVAQQKCAEHGIQYIVAMNSDDLDKIRLEEEASGEDIFDPSAFINSTMLTDDDGGGLFGIRF